MENPQLSKKEHAVLDLLFKNGEMYGLDMVKASSKLKRGAIYILLSRMVDKGYIRSRAINAPGIPRRKYSATYVGVGALKDYLNATTICHGTHV